MVIREHAEIVATRWIVGVDLSIADVADEQGAAEGTEFRRRQGQPPRRVERAMRSESPQEAAARVVHVDETKPSAHDFIAPVLVLLGVGNEEQVVNVLDVEWGKTVRQVRVLE